MKLIICTILIFGYTISFGQTNWRDTTKGIEPNNYDTCKEIEKNSFLNLVTPTRHPQPLFIANDVIVRTENLSDSTSLITNISVLKCPAAFSKFGYIAYNGVVIITTHQVFDTETPNSIRQKNFKHLKGNVIYALNGDIINDTALKISTGSIKEVELLKSGIAKGENIKLKKYNCISIWTLTKNERGPMSGLCRGIKIN